MMNTSVVSGRIYLLVISILLSLTTYASPFEDTVSFESPLAAMSGIYTVNPAQAVSATNFVRIGQADTALMTNGINGAVTSINAGFFLLKEVQITFE